MTNFEKARETFSAQQIEFSGRGKKKRTCSGDGRMRRDGGERKEGTTKSEMQRCFFARSNVQLKNGARNACLETHEQPPLRGTKLSAPLAVPSPIAKLVCSLAMMLTSSP